MYLDLTAIVSQDNPLIQWAKSQDNPYIAMGHVGTHLDTYERSSIPLEYIKSVGILFDVRNINEVFPEDISVNDIPEKSFVIFRTGQMEKYRYGDKQYFDNHPQLSHELIKMLCERKIRFIGIDCAGIRQHAEHEETDRICERSGIYIIENICNLHYLKEKMFTVYTMWMEDNAMTGLKCRVIIDTDNNQDGICRD